VLERSLAALHRDAPLAAPVCGDGG
jgi:hypothetical protein